MPINNITQTISTIPETAHRGVDVQTIFVTKQEDFQDHLQGVTVNELNTLKDQLNSRIGEINSTATTMNGYATSASSSASTATVKASEASASASEASASASEASASASQALTNRNQAETFAQQAKASAESVDVNNLVHRTGNETIAGIKTFSSNIVGNITGNSGTATNASNLGGNAPQYYQQALGFTPIQQGGGASQGANKIYIGWQGPYLRCQIDTTDFGTTFPMNIQGNAATATALSGVVGSAPSYACRAWVNFNGTGTVAIRASGNVSSITDNGVGHYTVNFTTAMPDANYSVPSTILSQYFGNGAIGDTTRTTTAVNVRGFENGATTPADCLFVELAVFR